MIFIPSKCLELLRFSASNRLNFRLYVIPFLAFVYQIARNCYVAVITFCFTCSPPRLLGLINVEASSHGRCIDQFLLQKNFVFRTTEKFLFCESDSSFWPVVEAGCIIILYSLRLLHSAKHCTKHNGTAAKMTRTIL